MNDRNQTALHIFRKRYSDLRFQNKNDHGFTLIEVLVVIGIIDSSLF